MYVLIKYFLVNSNKGAVKMKISAVDHDLCYTKYFQNKKVFIF